MTLVVMCTGSRSSGMSASQVLPYQALFFQCLLTSSMVTLLFTRVHSSRPGTLLSRPGSLSHCLESFVTIIASFQLPVNLYFLFAGKCTDSCLVAALTLWFQLRLL